MTCSMSERGRVVLVLVATDGFVGNNKVSMKKRRRKLLKKWIESSGVVYDVVYSVDEFDATLAMLICT